MFTGIVTHLGRVQAFDGRRLKVDTDLSDSGYELGESIAINGVCLTVVDFDCNGFFVELSPETLSRTCRLAWEVGQSVNLERALKVGDRLGGHWVQGHVDGLGVVKSVSREDGFHRLEVECPKRFHGWLIEKGSICVHGISLTINRILQKTCVELMIIPHTWENTTLKNVRMTDQIHLEGDVLGKYVERQLQQGQEGSSLSGELLARAGFGGKS